MAIVSTSEAKVHLSRLLARARGGEEITITRRGKPVAKLVPLPESKKPRGAGIWKGKFTVPDSFYDPLPEDELALWEGSKD